MPTSPINLEPYWQYNIYSFINDETGDIIIGWLMSAGVCDNTISATACKLSIAHLTDILGVSNSKNPNSVTLTRFLRVLYNFAQIS